MNYSLFENKEKKTKNAVYASIKIKLLHFFSCFRDNADEP